MDHKSWLWKKKSTEKAIIADYKSSLSSGKDGNETLLDSNPQLERDLKLLNEKLSSALSECTHKDDYAKKQAKIAQEAMAGWEKTETEALSLKQELDKALQQQVASEERLVRLDAALKECMQQLRFVREEQDKRIHDAVMKASKEFEITNISLDQKLAEARRRVSRLDGENSQLSKALLAKEKVIEELHNHREQSEAYFNSLITKLESTEKENSSLKYEVRVLEKELEIRNEEREFTRRTAEVSHKQHLESVKKIARLESECQRLRVLVRKRFPGPAAFAKMNNEVDMLRKNQSDSTPILRKINFLTEQLCLLEEENRNLKNGLNKKMCEVQSSAMSEMSLPSMSDIGSDDKASCAESWTSTLISDIEQFRNGKLVSAPSSRTVEASDISLMDDFVEMEKLAVISANNLPGSSNHKRVPANRVHSHSQDILQMVLEQSEALQLKPIEVLDEIKAALASKPLKEDFTDKETGSNINISRKGSPKLQSNTSNSIHKIVELIEGISIPPLDDCNAQMLSRKDDRLLHYEDSENPTGYVGRMFQWKASELCSTLKQFVQTCHDLLNGKSDLESFAEQLAITLEWIMNHCFSLQDVSSMKDAIRNYLDWDESRSESEFDSGAINHNQGFFSSPVISVSRGHKSDFEPEDIRPIAKEECRTLMSHKNESDQTEGLKSEFCNVQHQESHVTIDSLKEAAKHPKEKQNELSVDLETQLMEEAKNELEEACEKFVVEESEMENKEMRCDTPVPHESISLKETPDDIADSKRELQPDWEIVAASEKLAECQETILNLGKQLKAMASPSEVALFDKVISSPTHNAFVSTFTTPERNIRRRTSLLDKMLAEDKAMVQIIDSPKTEPIVSDGNNGTGDYLKSEASPDDESVIGSVALVHGKKRGGLLKRLLRRRNKGGC